MALNYTFETQSGHYCHQTNLGQWSKSRRHFPAYNRSICLQVFSSWIGFSHGSNAGLEESIATKAINPTRLGQRLRFMGPEGWFRIYQRPRENSLVCTRWGFNLGYVSTCLWEVGRITGSQIACTHTRLIQAHPAMLTQHEALPCFIMTRWGGNVTQILFYTQTAYSTLTFSGKLIET